MNVFFRLIVTTNLNFHNAKLQFAPLLCTEREITSFFGFAFQRKLSGLSALDCLSYIHKHSLVDLYQNLSVAPYLLYLVQMVALRVLSIGVSAVTVASCERTSKLKLIKTYFRSTMSQERLVSLAMISIEQTQIARYVRTI